MDGSGFFDGAARAGAGYGTASFNVILPFASVPSAYDQLNEPAGTTCW